MTNTSTSAAFLRSALRGNAAFSATSGTAFALQGASIGAFLGVPPVLVTLTGGSLLGFAAMLLYVAARPVPPRELSVAIVGADMAWVVGTVVLVALGAFTPAGAVAALAVGAVVLGFAGLQWTGIRRLPTDR